MTKDEKDKVVMGGNTRLTALDEYKILQDKTDKIGDFRFRVKGWAMTMMVAVIFTGIASSTPPWLILFAIPMVLLFKTLEDYQDLLQGAYVNRILVLEKFLFKNNGEPHFQSPAIGRSVSKAFWHSKRNGGKVQRFNIWVSSNFYFLLCFLIILGVIVKWALISDIDPSESNEIQKII